MEAVLAAPPTGDTPQQRGMLAALLRGMVLVGALAAAFGPGYAYTVLRLAYSQRWSSTAAPVALAAYSLYIPLLAVNGILEVCRTAYVRFDEPFPPVHMHCVQQQSRLMHPQAFVHAVADSRQLSRINAALIGSAAVHAAFSLALVRLGGAVGALPLVKNVSRDHLATTRQLVPTRAFLGVRPHCSRRLQHGHPHWLFWALHRDDDRAIEGGGSFTRFIADIAQRHCIAVGFHDHRCASHPVVCRSTDLMPSLIVLWSSTDFSETMTLGRGHVLPGRWHLMHKMRPAKQLAVHVSIGAACLAAVLLNLLRAERQSFTDALTVLRRREGQKAQ